MSTFRKPLVGINLRLTSRHDGTSYSYLSTAYPDAIARAGGIPVLLPPIEPDDDIEMAIGCLDALLFTGGHDLDCRNDGYQLHASMTLLDPRREAFDRALMRLAAEQHLPVLGIGCGMQLLNVSQGGTLYLHLPVDKPKALPHCCPDDPCHSHPLLFDDDTIMARIYDLPEVGRQIVRVTSAHHMAVDDVANGFIATARCPDGVVEAIESTTDWFAFGTQFHPEATAASKMDQGVFEAFVDGVRSRARLKALVA